MKTFLLPVEIKKFYRFFDRNNFFSTLIIKSQDFGLVKIRNIYVTSTDLSISRRISSVDFASLLPLIKFTRKKN